MVCTGFTFLYKYKHVCTWYIHVCTVLPKPAQVVRIPDEYRRAVGADSETSGRIQTNAIGGTAELALRYSIVFAFTAGPKHHSVMTTGGNGPAGGC